MASFMLAKDIIAQGLEIGGNTAITTLAQTFLNSFLDNLYRSHDWDFLIKEANFSVSGGSEVTSALPALYRVIRKVRLTDSDTPLVQQDFATLWEKIQNMKDAGTSGAPTSFCVNPSGTNLLLWPIPGAGTNNGEIIYYEQPAPISNFDTEFPAFPDSLTLVNAVADFAATYDRDSVIQIVQRNLDLALGKAVAGMDDIGRSRAQTLRFDNTVYGAWRGDNS